MVVGDRDTLCKALNGRALDMAWAMGYSERVEATKGECVKTTVDPRSLDEPRISCEEQTVRPEVM